VDNQARKLSQNPGRQLRQSKGGRK